MIRAVRNKVSRAPEDNYTEAACDCCEAVCAESRVPGGTGIKAAEDAEALARAAGWVERQVRDKRRRKMVWIVRLICPACQAEFAEARGEAS
jgi:hypothetical protein